MKRLRSLWDSLTSSFWFVPGLLTAGAVLLFVATLQLDQWVRAELPELPLVFSGGATAARSVLSTIAGSLITVVATVFSLTIVALQLASSSYSPRLLRSFTSDKGVQVVLGVYIGTFTYALLVLRIIRTSESPARTFIPSISVTTAVLLALICVGLLVYFVHHISNIIQSSTIVENAHRDTIQRIATLRDLDEASPEAQQPEDHPEFRHLLREEPLVVRSGQSGYVQYLNDEGLLAALCKSEKRVLAEAPYGPGHFVSAGLPILKVWPAPNGGLDAKTEKRVHDAFVFGKERAFQQDFAFGLRQLSDIALKGVSPGINDPTTSMQAIDRIESILIALGDKALPRRVQEREVEGTRILLEVGHYGFDDVAGLAFDQIRRASFTSGQVAVLERVLEVIERALSVNDLPERRRALWARAFAIGRLAPQQVSDPDDAVQLACKAARIGVRLRASEPLRATVDSDLERLARLAANLDGGERVREILGSPGRS